MIERRFRAPKGSVVHNAIVRRILTSKTAISKHIAHFLGGITIMPTNICNARCVFCSYRFNTDPKRMMPLDLFERVLDDARDLGYVGTVVLTPHAGEPLLDPTLFEKIRAAHMRDVERTILTTNGILLNRSENYRKLLDADPFEVNISTPGLDRDAYKRLFQIDKYDDVIDGLIKLAEYRREKGKSCRTSIRIFARLDRPPEQAFQEDGWNIIRPYLDDGTFTLLDYSSEFDDWSGAVAPEDLPAGTSIIHHSRFDGDSPPCARLLNDLAVLPDGKVRVCSCRYLATDHDELVIGDSTEKKMREIYYGPEHVELIRRAAKGNWPKVCRNCAIYQPIGFEPREIEKLYHTAIGDLSGTHWPERF